MLFRGGAGSIKAVDGGKALMRGYAVPCMLAGIMLLAIVKESDLCAAFARGVRRGLETVMAIFPVVLLMTVGLRMLEASGAIDILCGLLRPCARLIGLPAECLPLALLRPFSGSGAVGAAMGIMESCGVDSYPGMTAAVMLGAGETTFYVIGLYAAKMEKRDIKKIAAAALAGDIAAFAASAFFVRLFM